MAAEQSASEGERVQKALARMGYGSRREIEGLIRAQKIRINGQLAKIGDRVREGDKVNIGSRRAVITAEVPRIRVLIYNKPEGEICSRKDEQGRPTVFDNLGRLKTGRWIGVGRLDINSSGLMVFTNYGELANHMMHPSSGIEREYAVRVNGEVTREKLLAMRRGVRIDGELLKFEDIVDQGGQGANHWYHVLLREGKNREVRRLWQSQDIRVSRLIRVRYGPLILPRDLRQGKKRELELDEVKALFAAVDLPWPEAFADRGKKKKSRTWPRKGGHR